MMTRPAAIIVRFHGTNKSTQFKRENIAQFEKLVIPGLTDVSRKIEFRRTRFAELFRMQYAP